MPLDVGKITTLYQPILDLVEGLLQAAIQKFGTKFILTAGGVGAIIYALYFFKDKIVVTEWHGVAILAVAFLVVGWIITEYFKARNEQEARAVTPTPQP